MISPSSSAAVVARFAKQLSCVVCLCDNTREWASAFPYDFRDERMMVPFKELTQVQLQALFITNPMLRVHSARINTAGMRLARPAHQDHYCRHAAAALSQGAARPWRLTRSSTIWSRWRRACGLGLTRAHCSASMSCRSRRAVTP